MHPVYEPQEDSLLLKCYIKMYLEGKPESIVLDVGCGSGILTEEAAKYAHHVIAVDINPAAVAATNKLNLPNVLVRQSDLFSNVPEHYDLILFNAPYLPDDPFVKDIALDGGKEGYEVIARFLAEAGEHLKQNGKILLLFSTLTNEEKVLHFCAKHKFLAKKIAAEPHFMEQLLVYELRNN